MRKFLWGCTLIVAVPAFGAPVEAGRAGQWDAQAVAKSIEKAKAFLWSKWSEGHWGERGKPGTRNLGEAGNDRYELNYGGISSLCAYALLAAGESPQETRMKTTLDWLAGIEMHGTYARALRASVWGMLGRNSTYRGNLFKDVKWLLEAVNSRGAYTYDGGNDGGGPGRSSQRWDNSNSQLAVLGVWAGARNGIEVPRRYWELVEKHWKNEQKPDGGWSYSGSGRARSYGSMTAAGLATMFICFDAIHFSQFIECKAQTGTGTSYEPITRGLEWMEKNFSAANNPGGRGPSGHYYYYLYSVERVGLASGYKYFGRKDWYKMGAANLLRTQRGGGWGNLVDTSFALLFLARGQHPVLFNKMEYDGAWNSRPRDLANLTRWISRTFERQVNWQIIPLDVPVSEWHDAPILYISGAAAPKFSDDDLEAMRQFVYQGGTILSEAACNRAAFNVAMQKYYAKMFPRYELKRLPADHPVYNLHFKIRDRRRRLLGVSNGVRLLAVHSPTQMSLAWQMNEYATETDVFRQAANIFLYVTDKGSLRRRGVSPWPSARPFEPVSTLKVAIVKYDGNFQPEPLAWKRFSILMGSRYGVKVEVSEPTAITDLDVSSWPVAAMTGTKAFELTMAEREALRKYLDAGGVLIADAAGGSRAFAEAAQKEFARVLPEARYDFIPADHAIYTRTDTPIGKVAYRRALRGLLAEPHRPRLRAYSRNGRIAIVFSRYDLTAGLVRYPCWGLIGYEPDSAFDLMRNILLNVSGKAVDRIN